MKRQSIIRSAIVVAVTCGATSSAFAQDDSTTDGPTEPAVDPAEGDTSSPGLTFEATYPPDPTEQDNQWQPEGDMGPPNWLLEIEDPMVASRRWRERWMWFYGSVTAVQLTIGALADDPGLRADGVVGAASSAIGFFATMLIPYPMATSPVRYAQSHDVPLDEAFRNHDLRSEFIDDSLEAERIGRSWMAHAGGAFVSVLGGVVLMVGYERPASAAFNVVTGLLASEIQIATMPRTNVQTTPWVSPDDGTVGWQVGGTF